MSKRPSKRIVWAKPDSPVFCAARSQGASLFIDRPASDKALRNAMKEAFQAAGFLDKLPPHDLRRVAAREATQLGSGIHGGTTTTISGSLGLTESADNRHTTTYIGGIQDPVFNKCIDSKFDDLFPKIDKVHNGASY